MEMDNIDIVNECIVLCEWRTKNIVKENCIHLGNTLIATVSTMMSQWIGDDIQTNITQYVDGKPKQFTQSEL